MQKFTKINNKIKNKNNFENKYSGKNINIVEYENNDIIIDSDKIVILPYLKDDSYLLLKYEKILSFEYKHKNIDKYNKYNNVNNFISMIRGDIKKNENPDQSLKRVLIEECGLVLNHNYQVLIDKILFKDEKSTGQYYISLLELNYNDFKQIPIEKNNNTLIKVYLNELDNIKTTDLVTDYLLLKLKYNYKL